MLKGTKHSAASRISIGDSVRERYQRDAEYKRRNAEHLATVRGPGGLAVRTPESYRRRGQSISETKSDPWWTEKMRERGHFLPAMSPDQRRVYNKLRLLVSRDEALKALGLQTPPQERAGCSGGERSSCSSSTLTTEGSDGSSSTAFLPERWRTSKRSSG